MNKKTLIFSVIITAFVSILATSLFYGQVSEASDDEAGLFETYKEGTKEQETLLLFQSYYELLKSDDYKMEDLLEYFYEPEHISKKTLDSFYLDSEDSVEIKLYDLNDPYCYEDESKGDKQVCTVPVYVKYDGLQGEMLLMDAVQIEDGIWKIHMKNIEDTKEEGVH
ncbi:hypothetical protein [Alkalicoccobacillus gibsonii]|uniref:hypothetical protein n=1 Tax=Alkalicoccobacillus gibsonii TaxID=79881 RepID=UPI001932C68A|nr:hypothetical protein [Alkalicoccobacillus gibsonii]MBM0066574.1 hypothetical protein [Alkalicoccobacillus gibsonii]